MMEVMDEFDIDDGVFATASFTIDEELTDPTTVTFLVRDPEGATSTLVYLTDDEVTRISQGIYRCLLPTLAADGGYAVKVIGTGTAQGAKVRWFKVRAQPDFV